MEASTDEVESQWGRLILADDVSAAFGRAASRTDLLEIADEAIGQFVLEGAPRTWVMVILKDHHFLHGGLDPADWCPADDIDHAVGGVGDEAFLTMSGGLVARSGDRWTAGVRGDVAGEVEQNVAQHKDLLRRILKRTEADSDQWGTLSGGESASRSS